MLPVKIVIADDEHGILLLLESIINELEGALVVGTAENALDTVKLVKDQSPDIIFLDIELLDVNGRVLAENLREIKTDLIIVFITSRQEYDIEAFKLYAFDYITKPIDKESVKATFYRAQQMLIISEMINRDLYLAPRISINLGNGRVFVQLDEIFYIEKIGRYTFIHCLNGKFKTRQTLQELEQHLGMSFFRSHKSYIINVSQIERINAYPNSSYYEVKFKNYESMALLSRDRINGLMKYSKYNI